MRLTELINDERERCAKVAENWRSPHGGPRDLEVAQAIAKAIRRGIKDEPIDEE
jgi:hypothetical protein